MIGGAGAIAEIGEHRAEALMGRRQFGVGQQCRFVVGAGLGMPVGAKQEVGEIDARQRIGRVVEGLSTARPIGGHSVVVQRSGFDR